MNMQPIRQATGTVGTLRHLLLLTMLIVVVVAWRVGPQDLHVSEQPPETARHEADLEELETEALQLVEVMIEIEEPPPAETPEVKETIEQEVMTAKAAPPPAPPEAPAENPNVTEQVAQSPGEGDDNGRSPAIEGRFDMPVLAYVDAVQKRANGKLLVWDLSSDRAAGEVVNGVFRQSGSLRNYSSRARDLTTDLPGNFRHEVLEQVRQQLGFGIWRFVLLIPQGAEQRFENALAGALGRAGLKWSEVDLLRLRYRQDQGEVVALVEFAGINGKNVPINQPARLW